MSFATEASMAKNKNRAPAVKVVDARATVPRTDLRPPPARPPRNEAEAEAFVQYFVNRDRKVLERLARL